VVHSEKSTASFFSSCAESTNYPRVKMSWLTSLHFSSLWTLQDPSWVWVIYKFGLHLILAKRPRSDIYKFGLDENSTSALPQLFHSTFEKPVIVHLGIMRLIQSLCFNWIIKHANWIIMKN
jgi:hypothetical protein